MASYLAPILEKFLSEYFSNFNADNLSLGLSGCAELTDLNLRSDILDKFNLPFRVIGGKVGSLYISLGGMFGMAKLLTSTPEIEVTLKNVSLLAVPPSALPYDKEREEKKAQDQKRKDLASLQERRKAAAEEIGKEKNDDGEPGFVGQLIVGLINNIKIIVQNIHIRYEDAALNPGTPFSAGLILKSLTAVTTDEEWNETGCDKYAKTFLKLVNLEGLGVYWNSCETDVISTGKDTSDESLAVIVEAMTDYVENENGRLTYILGPLATTVKAIVTLKPEKLEDPFSLPMADVNMEMPKLGIAISNNQFDDVMAVTGAIKIMSASMRYKEYRPHGIPYKGHAKEWWKFANDSLLIDVRRRHKNWNWEHMKAHRELCRKYKEVYTRLIMDDYPTDEDKAEAAELEDKLDNFNVILIRSPIDVAAVRKNKLIEEKSKSLWYGKATLTKEELDEILSGKLPDDEVSNIYSIIDYQPPAPDAPPIEFPSDFAQIKAAFSLPLIQFQANNVISVSESKLQRVLNFEIRDIDVGFKKFPAKDGIKADLRIQDIGITGLENEGIPPPVMLRAVKKDGEQNFLSTCFEKNPLDSTAAIKLKFNSEQLEVTYHGETVQKLLECFTPNVKVEAPKAKSKVSILEKAAAQNVKNFLAKNEDMDIDINLSAPFIVIPEKGLLSENSGALIINLGKLTLKSKDRSEIPDSSPEFLDALLQDVGSTGKISQDILEFGYNRYELKLQDFKCMMALSGENKSSEATPGAKEPATLLNTGDLVIKLNQCALPEDPRLPKVKVDAVIPLLGLEITDSRLIKLASMALTFPIPAKPPTTSIASLAENPDSNLQSELEFIEYKQKKENVITSVKKGNGVTIIETTETTTTTGTVRSMKGFDPWTASQANNLAARLQIDDFQIKLIQEEGHNELLDFSISNFSASVKAKEFGTKISASIGGIAAKYSDLGDPLNPVHFLKTPINQAGEWNPVIRVSLALLSPDCPKLEKGMTKQDISVTITTLDIILHQECLGTVAQIVERLQQEMAACKPAEPELKKQDEIIVSQSKKGVEIVKKPKKFKKYDGHADDVLLKFVADMGSFSVVMMSKAKSILKLSLEAILVDYDDRPLQSVAIVNLDSITVLNLDTPTSYPGILVGMHKNEKLIAIQATTHKGERRDTEPDLEVEVTLGSHRITILGSFLGNIMVFVNHFEKVKKAVAKASKEAVKKAAKEVKEALASGENAKKMSVIFKLNAPEFVLPRSSSSREALVINLGCLQIHNKFIAIPTDDASRNAIKDDLVIGLKGLKLSRVLLNPDNQDVQAETPVILPISFDLNIQRNLSSAWYFKMPAIKAAASIEPAVVKMSGDDIILLGISLLNIVFELQDANPPPDEDAPVLDVKSDKKAKEEPETEEPIEPESQTVTWIASADVRVIKVGITLYTKTPPLDDHHGVVARDHSLTFAEIFLEDTTLIADIWSNSDMNIEFSLQNIVMQDTRRNEDSNEVQDFLQRTPGPDATDTELLLDLKFNAKTAENKQKTYNVNATTASFQMILNMTFIRVLCEFAKNIIENLPKGKPKPPVKLIVIEEVEEEDTDADADQTMDVAPPAPPIMIPSGATQEPAVPLPIVNADINLQQFVLVILGDSSSSDTNALMLQAVAIAKIVSKDGRSTGDGYISGCCYTAKYGSDEPTVEILSPSYLSFNLDMSPSDGILVDLTLSKTALRVSAGTILLISKIAKSVAGSMSALKVEAPPIIDNTGVWKGKNNSESGFWFLNSKKLANAAKVKSECECQADAPPALSSAAAPAKEKLTITAEGVALSVEVGAGTASTPVLAIDANMNIEVTNWSSNLLATGKGGISAAYNNVYFGKWEHIFDPIEVEQDFGDPVLRPWELSLKAAKANKDDPFRLEISSKDVLEVTLVKTAVATLTQIADSFKTAAGDAVSEADVKSAPYSLRNSIGYDVIVNTDNTPFIYTQDIECATGDYQLPDGFQIDFGLKANIGDSESGVQSNRAFKITIPDLNFEGIVNVSQGKSRFFPVPKQKHQFIMFDIEVHNGTSTSITIRGRRMIVNETPLSIEVYSLVGTENKLLTTVEPHDTFCFPLVETSKASDGLSFKAKGYELATVPFTQKTNLDPVSYSFSAKSEGGVGDNANVKIIVVPQIAYKENFDDVKMILGEKIHLKGHLMINNLLPIKLEFESIEKKVLEMDPGRSRTILSVTPASENCYEFNLNIPDYRDTSWTAKISLSPSDAVLSPAIFTSADGTQSICMGFQKVAENDMLTVNVYCPYWMINYTGETLSYQGAKGTIVTTQAPGESRGPVLFAYEKNLATEQALVKCGDSEWSQQVNLDATGVPGGVICESKDKKYELIVTIQLSECGLTKLVTFTARHNIVNACPYPIIVNEIDLPDQLIKVPAGTSIPFYPNGKESKLELKADDPSVDEATPAVYFGKANDTFLRLKNKYGGVRALVRVNDTSKEVTLSVSEYMAGEVPILIVNDTKDIDISFSQKQEGSTADPYIAYKGQSCLYAWDDPATEDKVLEWAPSNYKETFKQELNLTADEHGEFTSEDTGATYKWISFNNGLQRIVLVTHRVEMFDNLVCILDTLAAGKTKESDATEEVSANNDKEKVSFELRLELAGIGLSVVNNVTGKDIIYLRLNSTEPTWEASGMNEEHFRLMDHHIDLTLEHGYQSYISGVITDNPAVLEGGIEINFTNFQMTKPSAQQLRRHPYRPGLGIKFTQYTGSFEVDLRVSELQIDNQTDSPTYPRVFIAAPIPVTVTTVSEVHPPMVLVKVKKRTPPESSVQLISATIILQEFTVGADMGLVGAICEAIATDSAEQKSKRLFASYISDVELATSSDKEFFAKQLQEAKAQSVITVFEDVQIFKLKFNLSFSMAGATDSYNPLKVLVAGLGATLINITDKPFDIAGLHIRQSRQTPGQLVDQIVSHYKSGVIMCLFTTVLELDLLGNPYKLLTGLLPGVAALLTEPFQGAMQGHLLEGLSSGVGTLLDSTVGNLLGTVGLLTGSLAKGTEALGLGYILPLGYLSSGVMALRNIGKKKEKGSEPIRPPRLLTPNSFLEPYSKHKTLGALIFNKVQGGKFDYISHTFVEDTKLILLTEKKVYYVAMDEEKKFVAETTWGHKWDEFAEITGTENSIDFNQKYVGGWFGSKETHLKVNVTNPECAKWLLTKVQEVFARATAEAPK